jgi:hypothetical protein
MKTTFFAGLIGSLFFCVGCEHPERHAGGHTVDPKVQFDNQLKHFELVEKRAHDDGEGSAVNWTVHKKDDKDLPPHILAIVKVGDENFSIVLPATNNAYWTVFGGLGTTNTSQICNYDTSKYQIFDAVRDPKISTNWVLWLTNTQSTSSGSRLVSAQFLVPTLQSMLVSGSRTSAIYDGYYDIAAITLPWEEGLDNAKKGALH